MKTSTAVLSLSLAVSAFAQVQPAGVTQPIVEKCGSNGSVVCVNKYVSISKENFIELL